MQAVAAGVAAGALLGVASCGGASTAKTASSSVPAVTVSAGSTLVAKAGGATTPAASPSAQLPSAAVLKSALLTASDLGPAFTKMPDDNSGSGNSPMGCPKLDKLTGAPDPTRNEVSAVFEGHSAGPFLGETLAAGTPSDLASYFAQIKASMNSCHTLTFGSGSSAMTLNVTPVSFGSADTVALRMDGTTSGVQVTGYMTIDNLHTAMMGYYFIELFGGSSQTAYGFHAQALAKAQRVLGGQ